MYQKQPPVDPENRILEDLPADPEYAAPAYDPAHDWNERMWSPDEGYELRTRIIRSDEEIELDIASSLSKRPERIKVVVFKGTVAILGEVASQKDREQCYALVDAVPGVQHIFENLNIVG